MSNKFTKIHSSVKYLTKIILKLRRKLILVETYDIYIEHIESQNILNEFNVAYRVATSDDIRLVAKQFAKHYGINAKNEIQKRINEGDKLIVGCLNEDIDKICYISWMSQNEKFYKVSSLVMDLDDAICSYRALVPKRYRRMKIGYYGKMFSQNVAHDFGFKRKINFVERENIASRKMNEKFGKRSEKQLLRIVFSGHEILKIINGYDNEHFRK